MLDETVDSPLLPRRPAAGDDDDEDGDGDMLTESFASKSDIVLSNEYRYIFIWKHHQNKLTIQCTCNSIPRSIKNCSSLYSFKRHLKSHLITQLINKHTPSGHLASGDMPAPPIHA